MTVLIWTSMLLCGAVQLADETTLTALYGMRLARAKAFAIGLWACLMSVVIATGVVAISIEGFFLGELPRARGPLEGLQTGTPPE